MAIGFTSGQDLTAADLNALVPTVIVKAADESVASSTTMQNDNDFVNIPIPADTTWRVSLYAELSGTETGDYQSDWAVTGTCTTGIRHILGMPAGETDASNGNVALQARSTTSDVSNMLDAASGIGASYREDLIVYGGASGGTLTYRWSQNTSTASNSTMRAGSWMELRRWS